MGKNPIDAIWEGLQETFPLLWRISLGWFVFYQVIEKSTENAHGTLIGAGVGATLAYTIFWNNRRQGKRDTSLELFAEYYSVDFAGLRRKAEKFMTAHAEQDWSKANPYDVGRKDENLSGYGAILRYWQRVAILFHENELDRRLTQRLIARELGLWNILVFEPVFVRKGIYVREVIVKLVHEVANGPARDAFKAGERDGESLKRKRVVNLEWSRFPNHFQAPDRRPLRR